MQEILVSYGYPALFLLSFLAATLMPLGSEWLLIALLLRHSDPLLTVAVATAGNTLGAWTTYLVGVYGGPFLMERVLRIDRRAQSRAEELYRRYGRWSLLFTWLPVVGDPLCLAGGLLRVDGRQFILLAGGGKFLRYGVLAWLTLAGKALLG